MLIDFLDSRLSRLEKHFLPNNAFGDKWISLRTFMRFHKRLPRRRNGSLNDASYFIKTGPEIRAPIRTFTTDKEYLKIFVAGTIGNEFNVSTLAVLHSPSEAEFFNYPDCCVIKPTHLSGEVMFRRDGGDIDLKRITSWFQKSHYRVTREANYKDLSPKVIVEPYIFDGKSVHDYKIFCVWGEPKLIWVDIERHHEHLRSLYTPSWDYLPYLVSTKAKRGPPLSAPENMDTMLAVAAKLSQHFSLVRVDLYSDGTDIAVGELTNTSGNTRSRFCSEKAERHIAELLFGPGGYCGLENCEK